MGIRIYFFLFGVSNFGLVSLMTLGKKYFLK